MTKRLWVFPAVSCLLLATIQLGKNEIVGIMLLVLLFVRIACLKNQSILLQTLILSLFFVGATYGHEVRNQSMLDGNQAVFLISPVVTSIKIDGDRLRFDGIVLEPTESKKEEKVVVRYYMQSEEEKEKWLHSTLPRHFVIAGELIEIAPNSNFHQFNYQAYLKRRNIHWQLDAIEIQHVDRTLFEKPQFYWIEQIRGRLLAYIDESFHEKIASYLKILFMADRRGLPEKVTENYRALGVIHLFSISGFHISYLVRILKRLLLRLGITHEGTNLFLVIILPLYGILAGLGVSVFRAVTQTTALLWGEIFNKKMDIFDAWSLAMIFSLFVNPYHVFDLSFQLSYTLSGIFIVMSRQQWIRELQPIFYALFFSLLSGFASLPILTYHFFEISWITVFANVLFIPLFTYILFPGLLILLVLSLFFSNASFFLFLNEFLSFFITEIESLLSVLTNHFDFSFITGRLPALALSILIISIIRMITNVEQKRIPSTLTVLCMITCLFWNRISPVGYIVMLDVGQGDSILIKEPFTHKITLIDTGGQLQWQTKETWQEREESFSIGKDIVVPALKSFGVSTIDRLYITHADADHMGELEAISRKIPIKEIATTKVTFEDEQLFKKVIQLEDTQLIEINAPMEVKSPVSNGLVLHPIKPYQSKNDQSLVLYVKMGEERWLFTGDIEEDAERDLIREFPNLRADYLKVAHHGSQTSSTHEFIQQVQPTTAFISVGANNTFGHPNEEVLQRLLENDIQIYTTADKGAVKVDYLKVPLLNRWLTNKQTVK